MLRHYLGAYRGALSATAALSASSAVCTIAILDQINRLASHPLLSGYAAHQLVYAIGWLAALLLLNASSQYLSSSLGARLVAQLRSDLSRRLIELTYERLANQKHIVFGAFISDIAQIAPLVLLVPLLAYNALLVIACAVYLLGLSPPLFGVLALGLSPLLTISWVLLRATRGSFDELRSSDERVFEFLRAISEGKKELCLNQMRATHFAEELLDPAIRDTQRLMTRAHLRVGINQAWSSTMVYMSIFAVVYVGHVLLSNPLGTIIPFVLGSFFLIGPLTFLIQVGQQVSAGMASVRHLERLGIELQSNGNSAISAPSPKSYLRNWRDIQARDLCYRFPSEANDSPRGAGPICLDIRRGESIFIVGGNGSGKSTLLLLLCGLLHPCSGELLIDGVSAHDNLRAYQDLFSGVFSDFFLFRHLLDGRGVALPDDVAVSLLQKLEIDDLVHVHGGELSHVNLSSGQRKRLALLHCLAENRDIVFLDEWAADQDPIFRDYFYRTLLSDLRAEGKTLIVISHDDRYFHLADRLIKLDAGLVVSDVRLAPNGVAGERVS